MQAVESLRRVQTDRVLIKFMAFHYYFMHFPQPSSSLNESHQRGERTKDSGFDASETVGFETGQEFVKSKDQTD